MQKQPRFRVLVLLIASVSGAGSVVGFPQSLPAEASAHVPPVIPVAPVNPSDVFQGLKLSQTILKLTEPTQTLLPGGVEPPLGAPKRSYKPPPAVEARKREMENLFAQDALARLRAGDILFAPASSDEEQKAGQLSVKSLLIYDNKAEVYTATVSFQVNQGSKTLWQGRKLFVQFPTSSYAVMVREIRARAQVTLDEFVGSYRAANGLTVSNDLPSRQQ
ncbi:MAG: hypothetical protein V4671_21205 [Armatimonadota bacterium]